MLEHRIGHPRNEASGVTSVHNQRILDAFGWDVAFWIAGDEGEADECVSVLGRRIDQKERVDPGATVVESDGSPGSIWEVMPCKARRSGRSTTLPTDDTESLARAGSWIYVFGSQFGSKDGPLDPRRHFIARFNEALVEVRRGRVKVKMDVARPDFALHRAVNDALSHRSIELIAHGRHVLDDFIRATKAQAIKGELPEARDMVEFGDAPINVEGVTFLPTGRLLLGLRYPVTVDGHPILVEIDGIDRVFARNRGGRFGHLHATRVLVLSDVGSKERPAGIREIEQHGQEVHVITGSLDSDPSESSVLSDHPEGERAAHEHRVFTVPDQHDGDDLNVRTRLVRTFDDGDNVEGLVLSLDGATWYIHDDEIIRLDEVDRHDRAGQGESGPRRLSGGPGPERVGSPP